MLPGEHQQVLSNLQSRFEDFLEDSQESQVFSGSDITQLEKEVNVCKQYYQELLKSAERGKAWEFLSLPTPTDVCLIQEFSVLNGNPNQVCITSLSL